MDTLFKLELSKALEIINFRVLQEKHLDNGAKEETAKHWISNNTKPDDIGQNKMKDQLNLRTFQKAMRILTVWGHCIGLNPVTGILQKDVSKMRFTKCSFKFLFAMVMAIAQTIVTMLTLYRFFRHPKNLSALNYLIFCSMGCLTTISFIRLAPKWPRLMKELINSRLDEYIQPDVIKRCNIACAVFMGMGLMEYIIAIPSRIVTILECPGNVAHVGELLISATSPWLSELNVPYVEWLGVIVQCLNLVATAAWNYADIFIVCISLYLTSIMEQINKKITLTASKNYVPATTWALIREDYTRAVSLVKLFDDVFSGIVLISFANNLIFICLKLHNVLVNGAKSTNLVNELCPGREDTLFRIYLYPTYLTYEIVFHCVRFLTVALVASGINTSSLQPRAVLHAVPASSYCKEVERFQNQVSGDTVALSGLHFFYINKELLLTVAGTLVTYELVLLQFSYEG